MRPRTKPFPDFAHDWPRLLKRARLTESGCWEWQGYVNNMGYGRMSVQMKLGGSHVPRLAHRCSYVLSRELADFPVESVLHKCDNARCVNPEHLYLGTHIDNMKDMRERGRSATGAGNGSNTKPERRARGERNAHAKLSEDQVREIRRAYALGHKQDDLAAKYGVGQAAVSSIVTGKRWKHIS